MLAIYGDEQLVEQLVTLVNLVTKPQSAEGQSLAFVRTEKTPAQKLRQAILSRLICRRDVLASIGN